MEQLLEDADRESGSLRSGLKVDDDYLTVTMLSAGLARLLERRLQGGQLGSAGSDGLLPSAWRIGFARLWWRCQEQGVPALDNDLDLLAWCTRPFAAWPVSLLLSEQDLQNCLIVGEELSGFAEQGARLAVADVEAEWREKRVYLALRAAASVNGGEDDLHVERIYAVLRRRLIDYPTLTDLEVKRWEREFPRTDGNGQTYVQRLIEEAYVARPASGTQMYLRCPDCHNTVPDASAPCGTTGCPAGPAETMTVSALAVVYDQHRAARRFVHDPGLVEARILDALSGENELAGQIRITPYPRLDTLDILIEFLKADAAGTERVVQTWGVDAKDQDSARLLGRSFMWPDSIKCDRRFLALPTHRKNQPGYVDDLVAELDGRVDGVEVVDERQLVSMVKATARRLAK